MSGNSDLNAVGLPVSQDRLPAWNRRFDFGSYAETRQFLDQMADMSKRENFYPNVSFGKTYANIGIDAADQATLVECNSGFIREMEALAAAITSC